MMKVKIVAVGRVKEKYFTDAMNEYLKRLTRFAKVEIKEVKECNFTSNEPSESEIKEILRREGEEIKKELSGYVVVMAIEGKKYSSESFAKEIENVKNSHGELTLVIGGSYGVDKSVKDMANGKISFSDMTFPHTLMRVILLEQLYRAFTISADGKYHK